MKQDFVQILIPKGPPEQLSENNSNTSPTPRSTAIHTINFPPTKVHKLSRHKNTLSNYILITVLLILLALIMRHETQLNQLKHLDHCGGYEDRITALELEVQRLKSDQASTNSHIRSRREANFQHISTFDHDVDQTGGRAPVRVQTYYRGQRVSSGVTFPPITEGEAGYQSYDSWIDGVHQQSLPFQGSHSNSNSDFDPDSHSDFESRMTSGSLPQTDSQGRTYSWNRTVHRKTSYGREGSINSDGGSRAGLSLRNRNEFNNYEDEDTQSEDSTETELPFHGVGSGGSYSSGSSYQRSSSNSRVSDFNSNGCITCGARGAGRGSSYSSEVTFGRGGGGSGGGMVHVAATPSVPTTPEYVYTTRASYRQSQSQSQNQYQSRSYEQDDSSEGVLNIGGAGGRRNEPELSTMLQIPHTVLRTSSIDLGLGQTNLFPSRAGCNVTTPTPCGQGQGSSSYNYTYVREYSTPQQNYTYTREYNSPSEYEESRQSESRSHTSQTREQDRTYRGHAAVIPTPPPWRVETVPTTTPTTTTTTTARSTYISRDRDYDRSSSSSSSRHQERPRTPVQQSRRTSCPIPKPLAAHYVAEVSNYATSRGQYGQSGSVSNTRVRNVDGIFKAWKPAEWMTSNVFGVGDDTPNFVLAESGALTVKRAGLYYVYAQIHYEEEEHLNGFIVEVNSEPFLQCTRMTSVSLPGQREHAKTNSCFTAGIRFINTDDQIIIKDIEVNRYSVVKSEKSFFGLMNIGGACF